MQRVVAAHVYLPAADGEVVRWACVCVSPVCAAGFEGCSMVPSIYPLETLHNSLSLKQVDEFLNTVCESSSESHAKTMKGGSALGCGRHLHPCHTLLRTCLKWKMCYIDTQRTFLNLSSSVTVNFMDLLMFLSHNIWGLDVIYCGIKAA